MNINRISKDMTYKEKLLELLKVKNDYVKKNTGLVYNNDEDVKEVESWPEEKCLIIIEEMKKNFKLYCEYTSDIDICPWCILYEKDNGCEGCTYGARHGFCMDEYSDDTPLYIKINSKIGFMCEISEIAAGIKSILGI